MVYLYSKIFADFSGTNCILRGIFSVHVIYLEFFILLLSHSLSIILIFRLLSIFIMVFLSLISL